MTRIATLLAALALAGCGAAAEQPNDPAAGAGAPPPPPVSIPTTALIVCGPDGASVATPEVAASTDGVHVEIRNETQGRQIVHVQGAESGQGEGFSEGAHTRVWTLPPGSATVSCADPADEAPDPTGASFEIIDVDGVWVSTALDCENVSTATFDWIAGAPGVKGDPAEVVKAESEAQLEPGDVVEAAGYPEAEGFSTVRVVRDGRVISTVDLVPTDDGGWLISTTSTCDEP
ncbi:MAG TPA: hypothetical protein VFO88_01430 [Gaiellaceae bacterium]|nr:hypothetical protein [Gaiellaceae bacterium]